MIYQMYTRYSPAGGVVPSSYNKAISSAELGNLTALCSQAIDCHKQITAQQTPTANDITTTTTTTTNCK